MGHSAGPVDTVVKLSYSKVRGKYIHIQYIITITETINYLILSELSFYNTPYIIENLKSCQKSEVIPQAGTGIHPLHNRNKQSLILLTGTFLEFAVC